jgi:hypothetical protein
MMKLTTNNGKNQVSLAVAQSGWEAGGSSDRRYGGKDALSATQSFPAFIIHATETIL